jgi:lysophospholipase L1-like esterase
MGRRSAGLALVLAALVACTSETVVSTSAPTTVPASSSFGSGGSTWRLVAIGDSISAGKNCPGCVTFVDRYAAAVARRAGVTVVRSNWSIPGLSSGRMLDMVVHDPSLRSDIAGANVITVTIGVNDLPWTPGPDECKATPREGQVDWSRITPACLRRTAARYATELDRVLDEIDRLRNGKTTLLRLTGEYDDWIGRPGVSPQALATVARGVRLFDLAERRAAAAHGATYADLLHRFNGPSGRGDAAPYLELSHGVHPNQRGHDLIAQVLWRLGLAPLR